MKKLVIFGLTDAAELALYYFSSDSDYEVEAFVVDAAFIPSEKRFKGLPVVALMKPPRSTRQIAMPSSLHSVIPSSTRFARKNIWL